MRGWAAPGRWVTLLGLALIVGMAPACRQTEAERTGLSLEHALRDTQASLAALGTPKGAGKTPVERTIPMSAPPSASVPRLTGANPPTTAALLQGRDPSAVISALGEPSLRRREGDAEIWLYQAAHCRLDLVFYPEATGPVLAHAAARAFGTRRLTEAACLSAIATAPNPPPWTVPAAMGGG